MSKGKTVLCICKYCGENFCVDSRHSYANCCGKIDCRRKAACGYSKLHYHKVKCKNPSAFANMLTRKKAERLKRLRNFERASDIPGPVFPVLPQMRPVSIRLLYVVMGIFFSLLAGTQSPTETTECISRHLERASLSFDSPAFQKEIEGFLMFVQAQFPHFGPRPGKGAPHIR